MKITINNAPLAVKVLNTDEAMAQGLQNVPEMPYNKGLLFDLGVSKDVTYHTKNCLFPMDIMFIDANKSIIKILHSVQPEQNDLNCENVRWVVETNGGWAKDNGVMEKTKIASKSSKPSQAQIDYALVLNTDYGSKADENKIKKMNDLQISDKIKELQAERKKRKDEKWQDNQNKIWKQLDKEFGWEQKIKERNKQMNIIDVVVKQAYIIGPVPWKPTNKTVQWDDSFITPDKAKIIGDRKYTYVRLSDFDANERSKAIRSYPNKAYADEHYYYPAVSKDGKFELGKYTDGNMDGDEWFVGKARRVLAIPNKVLQDDTAMQELGYEKIN